MGKSNLTEQFVEFRDVMLALAVANSEYFYRMLFSSVIKNEYPSRYGMYPRKVLSRLKKHPGVYAKHMGGFDDCCGGIGEDSSLGGRFKQLCWKIINGIDEKEAARELELLLADIYADKDVTRDLLFLLKRSDEETVRQFADMRLSRQETFQNTSVDILVKKNQGEAHISGNVGHYLIYTRQGEHSEEKLLKFANQASYIYYLMFLIHHCQKGNLLSFVELRLNQEPFLELYRQVYDEHESTLLYKFKNLLQREDSSGKIRAGRLHEIVYDIRKHLENRFEEYGESYLPYAMTARHHLTVGAEHIHFEGDARQLLLINFV